MTDPDRALVGYALTWGRPVHAYPLGIRYTFVAGSLDRFVADGMAAPLRVSHEPTWQAGHWDTAGRWTSAALVNTVGAVRRWHPDSYGLLALGAVDPGPLGDTILDAVQRGQLWGLSGGFGGLITDPPEVTPHPDPWIAMVAPRDARVLKASIGEVSLTGTPADPCSRVLAVGADALELWEHRDLLAAHAP